MLPPDGGPDSNRLIHEKSPYLLQHARNPVDWYPWGEEAFARAREEDKPIFLSVGYSTCHWCHVMERESFEKEDVAEVLNANFIPIKVDREERPDIDETYMNATQLLTGGGGWPNSVWLTPGGKPWYAGTYFPPEDRFGRPGFKTLLKRLAEIWKTRRQEVEEQADRLSETMAKASSGVDGTGDGELSHDLIENALRVLRDSFDPRMGGFGGAPKFPPHSSLCLLIHQFRRTQDQSILEMVTRTLDAMSLGGIHDHIGGGFHRYSTDAQWFLPHFEKMLYDNAQLSRAYVDAYLLTRDEEYRRYAEDVYSWVLRDMTGPEGGFYSALDADSEGEEGKFYLWSRAEILEVLGEEEGELFCRVYGVEEDGNFRDETTGTRPGTSILYLQRSIDLNARAEGIPEEELRSRLEGARRKLLERRNERIWPRLDDKILTGWNGLMVESLAYAGRHLRNPEYTPAAEKAADFILDTLKQDGRLLHTFRDGEAKLNAYLDDYAFFAHGLLELYETTGNKRWLDEARELVEVLLKYHRDEDAGGFFFTSSDHEDLLYRSKDPYDRAIPSGNGMAARVLLRLAQITGESRYREHAEKVLWAFLPVMERLPHATETLILAVAEYVDSTLLTETSPRAERELTESQADATASKRPVRVDVFASRLKVTPGEAVRLAVRITIEEGWHINSSQPLQDNLIPTSISLGKGVHAVLGEIRYPPGKTLELEFSPKPLSVYEHSMWIEVPVIIDRKAEPGTGILELSVRFQACNDRSCLLPESLPLSIPLEVSDTIRTGESRHRKIFNSLAATRPNG